MAAFLASSLVRSFHGHFSLLQSGSWFHNNHKLLSSVHFVALILMEVVFGLSDSHHPSNSLGVYHVADPSPGSHVSEETVGTSQTLYPRIVSAAEAGNLGTVVLE